MASGPTRFLICLLLVTLLAPLPCLCSPDTTKLAGGGGTALDIRKHELTPGVLFSFSYGRYRLDGPFLNVTILTEDSYNDGKTNVSAFGLINWLAISFVGLVHPEDVGWTAFMIVHGLVFVPSIVFNSQHHFRLIQFPLSESGREVGMSLFCGTKTDYYPAWSAGRTKWFRFSYGLGAEIQLIGARAKDKPNRTMLSIQSGINWPHDYLVSDNTKQKEHRDKSWFIAFKYMWYIGKKGQP